VIDEINIIDVIAIITVGTPVIRHLYFDHISVIVVHGFDESGMHWWIYLMSKNFLM
jgi:hypothetical protein